MTGRGTRWLVLAVGLGLIATSSVATSAGATSRTDSGKIAPPEGLPRFYAVPGNLPSKPGELVKSQKIKAPGIDGALYRVMYTSTNVGGDIVPVTGVIAVPDEKAPKGGFPVVTWAHGTTGMADECAPSLKPSSAAVAANQLLAQHWVVVATDYEGLGTPGLHPYLAGVSEGNNTLDMVRAARNLEAAHAGTDYVVWGHSQGGHSALFAWKLAAEYAPELDLRGVVAGALPSQFALLYNALGTSPVRHYLIMVAGGWNAAYGNSAAPLDKVLNQTGIDLVGELETGCTKRISDLVLKLDPEATGDIDPATVPEWKALIDENDAQNFTDANDVPILIIHGGADTTIPEISSELLKNHLCGIGDAVERWEYPGQSHAGVIEPSLDDMIAWITLRFNDSDDAYTPTGQPDVEATTC